jgi:addiction module HigA family antidote
MIPTHRPPTHPGEMLLEEFLKPLHLSQVRAANRLGLSFNRLNELINRKRGVTADTALRLEALFGTGAEVWMTLQARWDLWLEQQKGDRPRIRPIRQHALHV